MEVLLQALRKVSYDSVREEWGQVRPKGSVSTNENCVSLRTCYPHLNWTNLELGLEQEFNSDLSNPWCVCRCYHAEVRVDIARRVRELLMVEAIEKLSSELHGLRLVQPQVFRQCQIEVVN